jgi:predicted DNA-binding protein YlxM (UPF0122 family)
MTTNNENLRLMNYVFDGFQHLMTKNEKKAVNAIIFENRRDNSLEIQITFSEEVTAKEEKEILELLKDGEDCFRKNLFEKLIETYSKEIYQNRCPNCQTLPRTAKSKQCSHCYYSW